MHASYRPNLLQLGAASNSNRLRLFAAKMHEHVLFGLGLFHVGPQRESGRILSAKQNCRHEAFRGHRIAVDKSILIQGSCGQINIVILRLVSNLAHLLVAQMGIIIGIIIVVVVVVVVIIIAASI